MLVIETLYRSIQNTQWLWVQFKHVHMPTTQAIPGLRSKLAGADKVQEQSVAGAKRGRS